MCKLLFNITKVLTDYRAKLSVVFFCQFPSLLKTPLTYI